MAEAAARTPPREVAEYLCTLQPLEGSALANSLAELRARCQEEYQPDETGLYPPHVSVTGFFEATPEQAEDLRGAVPELAASHAAVEGALDAQLRRIVSTECGHVLVDVWAPGVAALAQELASWGARRGLRLRPKAVRHLSLASRRPPAERARIARLYEALPLDGPCELELVLSRVVRRSSPEQLGRHGCMHAFCDVLRWRLPGGAPRARATAPQCAEVLCAPAPTRLQRRPQPQLPTEGRARAISFCSEALAASAATPLRKRHSEPTAAEEALLRQITPVKLAKAEAKRPRHLARLASCPACISREELACE